MNFSTRTSGTLSKFCFSVTADNKPTAQLSIGMPDLANSLQHKRKPSVNQQTAFGRSFFKP